MADRIAGALVDLAYMKETNPKIAVEVLIGHGLVNIIAESSVDITGDEVNRIVKRITNRDDLITLFKLVPQDIHLANNQENEIKCGDNGIFRGVPLSEEEILLSGIARSIYTDYPYDGKYVLGNDKLIICQSNIKTEDLQKEYPKAVINPLGEWTGGLDVDSGATNRKLGSDMAQSITGGGLHGKDLSKADITLNIYAFRKAQKTGKIEEIFCAIGDSEVDGRPYKELVEEARLYIQELGGFEKFAEWGLY